MEKDITHQSNLCRLLDKKRILITGGSGLIGQGLLRFFYQYQKRECELEIVSTYLTRKGPVSGKNITQIAVNFKNEFDLSYVGSFDFIFHCATYGQPSKFLSDKLSTLHLNTFVTNELFSLLKPGGSFVFLSSSEIYSGLEGIAPNEDQVGTSTPQHDRAAYIEGKRAGEAILQSHQSEGFNTTSVRLALAYGPGVALDDKRVLNQFVVSALKNNFIQMLDKGGAIRRYIFVDDAVSMIVNAGLLGKSTVYNVGGLEEVTILELATKIQKLTRCDLIVPSDADERPIVGAPTTVGLNIQRYCSEFGSPLFRDLSRGLESTIQHYRSLMEQKIA